MKSKNLIALVVVLGILIVIYLIQNLGSDKVSVSESLTDLFPDFNSSSVTMIKAYKHLYPDSGLTFIKTDGDWYVESYFNAPAKESEIDKLFTDIKKIQGEVRSTSQDLFPDYEIADDVALHVEFLGSDSSQIAHILFGKGVPQASRSSFMRNFGSDTVYMANENFISRFAVWNAEPSKKMPAKRWIELNLAAFDKEQVKSIELIDRKKAYLFEKHEEIVTADTIETTKTVWTQVKPDKDKLEEKKITDLLNRVSSLRGMDIISTEILPEYKLDKPSQTVGVTLDDGTAYRFGFGGEADTTSNSRYLKVEGKPHVYTVAKYTYESIFVNPFKEE